jgi:hypothetical protein
MLPSVMISSPWAILLCKFNDNDTERPRKFYDDMFTTTGSGNRNMIDYFRDMSHGTLDLSGSKTFGWFTLDKSLKDYKDYSLEYFKTHPDNPNGSRTALVDWAKEAATRYRPDIPKVDLDKFAGVVVVYNVRVDLFGLMNKMAAVCDDASVKPAALGQEMGHGYGLAHSRYDALPGFDYKDPWDIMSVFNAFSAPHPNYDSIGTSVTLRLSIGPGLNAANMHSRGWLDHSRVWKTKYAVDTVVELRPLHRRDLPGFLAIYIDNFFIEFRMNEDWDAGFPEPIVIIHYLEDNYSYRMDPVLSNNGDKFEIKEGEHTELYHHLKIELQDIDVNQRKARISIDYTPIRPFVYHKLPYEYISPAIPLSRLDPRRDIEIIHEKIINNPEWPLRTILKSLADISSMDQFNNTTIRIRKEALETIIKIANKELNLLEIPGGVALPIDSDEQMQ